MSNLQTFELISAATEYNFATSWLIKGLIEHDTFGIVYGASGSYKSFHAIDWACHIATGTPWKGQRVEQGNVVYIAGEGRRGVMKRIKAWGLLNHKSVENVHVIGSAIDLTDEGIANTLTNTVKKLEETTGMPVQMVIIDTLARCFAGDENSSTDMGAFIKNCDSVKEACSCTVMAVHHTGKDTAKGARGSSALRAATDFEFSVTRIKDGEYKLQNTKQKDAEEYRVLTLELSEVSIGVIDSDGDVLTSLSAKVESAPILEAPKVVLSNEALIKEVIKGNGGSITKKELREHKYITMTKVQLKRAIEKALTEGALLHTPEPAELKTQYKDNEVYSLAENAA